METPSQDVIDRFAAHAMQAILSNPEMMQAVTKIGAQAITYDEAIQAVARKSYDVAMVMLAERTKRVRVEPEFTFKGAKKPLP